MVYPHENDLRQIARPDGRRVLESYIAGGWRELVGIEIVGTRLQDSGATAHLTLSVKLPCVITMSAVKPARTDLDACRARASGCPVQAEAPSFKGDAAALAQEIIRDHAEPCAIVIEEDGSPVGVAPPDAEELKPSATEGVPFVRTQQASAMLPGDELIEPRGGRYPAKRSAR